MVKNREITFDLSNQKSQMYTNIRYLSSSYHRVNKMVNSSRYFNLKFENKGQYIIIYYFFIVSINFLSDILSALIMVN